MIEELEAQAAARGDESTQMTTPLVPEHARMARRPLAAGARSPSPSAALDDWMRSPASPRIRGGASRRSSRPTSDSSSRRAPRPRKASRDVAGDGGTRSSILVILGVLGRLELALGNLKAAGEYLRELPARLLVGRRERSDADRSGPTRSRRWSPSASSSRRAHYLEQYELERGAARQPVGAGARCALSRSARRRGGRLSTARSRPSTALSPSSTSSPYPLERGRTLLCLGTVRRQAQQKKAAREALEQALAIFEELGARLWAEKARAELARISGRAPASEELTETERRVAELAAQGRTNKQIAAELYMGVSTVEAHLSHVYRKLGVRRAELAARLADPQGDPPSRGRSRPNLGFPGFRARAPEALRGRMVYVVERYLPGSHRSDLLRGLSRLEQEAASGTNRSGGALPRLDHRAAGRSLLLPVRRALRGGCRRGEPAGRPPVRPDRPRSDRQSERSRDEHLPVHPRDRRDQARSPLRSGRRNRRPGGSRDLGTLRVRVRQRQLDHDCGDGAGRPGLHVLLRPAPGYGDRHARCPGLHVLPGPAHRRGHDSGSRRSCP